MRRRSFLKLMTVAPASGLVHIPLELSAGGFLHQRGAVAQAELFKPSEAANSPIGEGIGIHPGRVVWIRDGKAASWDGATGHWWDDAFTDQTAVDRMISRVLRDLTGRRNDRQAWDALFRNFNETHRSGNFGYRRGEKIAIKINSNQDRSAEWGSTFPGAGRAGPAGSPPRPPQNGMPSPHAIVSLARQLIEVAGVPGEDITIYDAARNVGQPIYSRIKANPDRRFQAIRFVVANDYGLGGRIIAIPDKANPIRFSKAEVPVAYLPEQVTEAKYMINVALLRPHTLAGVTLIGKNHFGSVYFPNDGGWSPRALHSYVMRTLPMGSYNCLVDLMGHRHLGGKTMLYMLDALYSAAHNESNVYRFASFGDAWPASILVSQDPVALDSVGLDILRGEPRATELRGNADNYLHEAAQAGKPPSGTVYDPVASGTPLDSLGVHEHWNDARKYSRNLGSKRGIELVALL